MKLLVTLLLLFGAAVRLQAGDLPTADFAAGYSLEVESATLTPDVEKVAALAAPGRRRCYSGGDGPKSD